MKLKDRWQIGNLLIDDRIHGQVRDQIGHISFWDYIYNQIYSPVYCQGKDNLGNIFFKSYVVYDIFSDEYEIKRI